MTNKISLRQMRRMGLFEEIKQPEVVYHMTNISNVDSILHDGMIKTGNDYICFFCPTLKDILQYIESAHLDSGREYYDFDGKIHKAPPLNHEETVVLKLRPRYDEPMCWYKENNHKDFTRMNVDKQDITDAELARVKEWIKILDDCRICHYGDMRFKDDVEIVNLTDVEKAGFEIIRYSDIFEEQK